MISHSCLFLSLGLLLTCPAIVAPVVRGTNVAYGFGGLKIITGGTLYLKALQCSMITCADSTNPAYMNKSTPSISMPVLFTFPQDPRTPLFNDDIVTICKEQTTTSYQYAGPSTSITTYTTKLIPIGSVRNITNQTTGQSTYTSFTANVTTGTDIFEYHLGPNCDGRSFGQSIKFINPAAQVQACFNVLYNSTTTLIKGINGSITTITPKNPLDIGQLKTGVRSRSCYI